MTETEHLMLLVCFCCSVGIFTGELTWLVLTLVGYLHDKWKKRKS